MAAWRALLLDQLQFVDQVAGVVGRRLHRDHARDCSLAPFLDHRLDIPATRCSASAGRPHLFGTGS